MAEGMKPFFHRPNPSTSKMRRLRKVRKVRKKILVD
jgi:hypothetical protein